MLEIDLGLLKDGPHANLIDDLARKCEADTSIQAMWVGGSLAASTGDIYSDIDFRIAVVPEQIGKWVNPNWEQYLPLETCGGTFMRFGEQALLHHLLLIDGTIVDFYVQDTTKASLEPHIVILVCRDEAFREILEASEKPPAPLTRVIEGSAVRQFFVDYWITTHKEMKGLGRQYDFSHFVGLYHERMALLRAWYMQASGKDIDARATIHMLGALHKGLAGQLSAVQQQLLGLPSRTPDETVYAIEAIRAEMSQVGRYLADRYAFDYPHQLEEMVTRVWREQKEIFIQR